MLPMMLLTPRLLVTVAVLLMVADGARGHKPPGKKIPHPTTLVEEPGKTGSRDHERTGSYGGSRTTGTRGNEGTGSYGVQNHPEFDFSSDRENTPIEEEWKDSSVFLSIFDELIDNPKRTPVGTIEQLMQTALFNLKPRYLVVTFEQIIQRTCVIYLHTSVINTTII
ncbi:uncharacterized protein LOC132952277 isoform X2 [Metopolophium dirhodum]|uniref:uncharacterized protein LOC132952277 isoform X2 n=1 Tax=Metopolophium dirhodum TaxID=44670 RepID=UPI0029900D27|nr:uncharacterized protein LOC132952277 isoform X2 [Metopolophium dirhodum]